MPTTITRASRTEPKVPTTTPRIIRLPARTMAVVRTTGAPGEVGPAAMHALYGAVYGLKFELKKRHTEFRVEPLRARWPDAHLADMSQWTGIWAIPVPDGTRSVPQRDPQTPVALERWEYGLCAEVLHLGPYAEERPTVEALHRFVAELGYELAGEHEEEYLTRPTAKVQKTIIRYAVKRARRS